MNRIARVARLMLLLSLPGTLLAQIHLRRVTGVRVGFESVDPIALQFDVDTASLRGSTVDRLRDAGLDQGKDPSAPVFSISIAIVRSQSGQRSDALSVAAQVRLPTERGERNDEVVWARAESRQEIASYRLLPAMISASVGRLIIELTRDLRSATQNP